MRGRRREAEGAHVAETVDEAHDFPLGCRMGNRHRRIHSLGRFRIGGGTYFVWALPPNGGGELAWHELRDTTSTEDLVP